jgi:hypothetical protein
MPYRDGTGPTGQGSRTGRGMGNCAGQGSQGRPFGRGRGPGRGTGIGANTPQGNSWIQTQLNDLQAAIQRLTERLDSGKNE